MGGEGDDILGDGVPEDARAVGEGVGAEGGGGVVEEGEGVGGPGGDAVGGGDKGEDLSPELLQPRHQQKLPDQAQIPYSPLQLQGGDVEVREAVGVAVVGGEAASFVDAAGEGALDRLQAFVGLLGGLEEDGGGVGEGGADVGEVG